MCESNQNYTICLFTLVRHKNIYLVPREENPSRPVTPPTSASSNGDSGGIGDEDEDDADNVIDMDPTLWQGGSSTY